MAARAAVLDVVPGSALEAVIRTGSLLAGISEPDQKRSPDRSGVNLSKAALAK